MSSQVGSFVNWKSDEDRHKRSSNVLEVMNLKGIVQTVTLSDYGFQLLPR